MDTQRTFLTQVCPGRPAQPPRSLLARCRCRSVRLVLLTAMWLSLLPAGLLHADDEVPPVNDTWWGDVWRWVDGGQQWFAYQNVGAWGDEDGDDIPNGQDPYPWDASNNTGWWTASNVWSDATLHTTLEWAYAADRSWQLEWYDSDGDGLPNWCDPRPYDAANNTTWWNGRADVDGESREIGGVYQSDGLDWNDYDGDGLPNSFDPYPWDAANNTSHWGLEAWVDAILGSHTGMYAASGGWQDRDNDGLPDWADPYPDTATNNTSWWHGGEYWVNGQQQWFGDSSTPYATAWDDADGDGIPNFSDPCPYDAQNNTAWWSGEYQIDGSYRQLGGAFAASGLDWGDYDSDGIPNFVDPYLYDSGNNNYAAPATPTWQDSDGDGMADDTDPYPYDSTNNSWWDSYYATMWQDWGDSDGDGLPNFSDPYPYDATNNTTQWYAPEQRYVNGMLQGFGGSYATDTLDWNDYDGDGLPTFADPYPYDATNNTTTWNAPEQRYVSGALQQLGGSYATSSIDMNDNDADGIPNFADPYPDDPDNNTAWWWGQTWVDGAAQDVIAAYAANTDTSTWSDRDEDGLPDWTDPYPDDPDNNTAWWWGQTWVDGGVQDVIGTYADTQSATISWADGDDDGLPDWLDPYPEDATNNTAWWWDESYVDGEVQEVIAAYAADQGETLNWEDRDLDGLPDWADPYPDDFSNNTIWWQGDFYIDGALVTLSGTYADEGQNWDDSDGDFIPDFLDRYPADPTNNTSFWTGAAFIDGQWEEISAPYDTTSADSLDLTDTDGDTLPDRFDPYPASAANNTSFWTGGDFIIDGVMQHLPGDGSTYATDLEDEDGDGIPSFADPYPESAGNLPLVAPAEATAPLPVAPPQVPEVPVIFTGGSMIDWAKLAYIDGKLYSVNGTFPEDGPDWEDDDGDELPNFLDPYPADASNNTSFWTGSAMIDGAEEEITAPYASNDLGSLDLNDTDDDLLPNAFDPYPEDSTNNTSYWNGGNFTIDGFTQNFFGDGSAYATDTDDTDADGIPDFADPYPYDETNTALPQPDPAMVAEDEESEDGASADSVPGGNTPVDYADVAGRTLNSDSGAPLMDVPVPLINIPTPQFDLPVPQPTVPVPSVDVPVVPVPQFNLPAPQVTAPIQANALQIPASTAPMASTPPMDPATLGALIQQALLDAPQRVITDAQAIAAMQGQLPPAVHGSLPPGEVPPFKQTPQPTADDTDGDGLDDVEEALTTLTDPTNVDTDDDGLFDGWEVAHELDPLDPADINQDTDHDGRTNAEELQEGTDPANPDTDGGGANDGQEKKARDWAKLIEELREIAGDEAAGELPSIYGGGNPLDSKDDWPEPQDPPPDDGGMPPEPPEPPAPPTPPSEPEDMDDSMDDPGMGEAPEAGNGGNNGGGGDPPQNPPPGPNPPPQPPPPPPKPPKKSSLLDDLAKQKEAKEQAHKDRNKQLHKERMERKAGRDKARQEARDLNELLNHPHGNHGNGVKNAGARGYKDECGGAPRFQPSAEYAQTHGYQNMMRAAQRVDGAAPLAQAPAPKPAQTFAEQEKARQKAREDRNTRLNAEHKAGVQQRAAQRQAARDQNEILSHPHGNHGNGVKRPGARGIRTADNQDGALAFQASAEYAQSNAYKAAQREILFKQVGIDQVARQQREAKLEQQLQQRNQEWGDQFKPQLADDIAQRGMAPVRRELKDLSAAERQHVMETAYQQALRPGSGITAELMQNNPEFMKNWMNNQLDTIINGAPDTALPGVNNFANRPGMAGGGAADMGAGGGAGNGWDAVGFNPQQPGVGPDGATSRGVDPNTGYVNGEPSWHQPATADTDGDGIANHVENSIGSNPDNAADKPTKFHLWNLELKRREAALSAAQREAEAKQQKAEQEQRALEAEHQAKQDYEAEHPESVRQPGDVPARDDENHMAEVSVEEGRPLVKVTRTNADGSTSEVWTTPTGEELADNFIKNAETGAWEKRDYTERHNNQEKRLYSTALPGAVKKAEGSLIALGEVNATAATIIMGGAGVSGTVPKIIAMGKEAISEATGIPTGLKDAKDFIRNLFTKKALKQADNIAEGTKNGFKNLDVGSKRWEAGFVGTGTTPAGNNAVPQVLQNQAQGALGEAAVRDRLLNSNRLELVGEQVRVTTPGVGSYRVTDFLVKSRKTDRLSIIEVKTGGATRDATQRAKDARIADPLAPTTFTGNRADAVGFPSGTPTGPIRTFEVNASNLNR